jgi:hypothetical protein
MFHNFVTHTYLDDIPVQLDLKDCQRLRSGAHLTSWWFILCERLLLLRRGRMIQLLPSWFMQPLTVSGILYLAKFQSSGCPTFKSPCDCGSYKP